MESHEAEKNKKRPKKQLKKNSSAYLRQREKANARKRKFLDKMTEEEREIKRAKDRAYYLKKKAEKKVKTITEMTEREKRKQRKIWKEASKKYREKKKALSNIVNNTPPHSDDDLAATPSVRRTAGRKIVRKDRAKAYRKIKQQEKTIIKFKRKYETLKKRLRRQEKREQEKAQAPTTPNSKVDTLLKNVDVPPEVRKNLLFNEVLTTQLKEKASALKKNSKEREVFQKCVSGNIVRKYKLLHMAKIFLPKERTSTSILKSDTKIREVVLKPEVRQKVTDFFERDDVSRMCPAKRDFVKKNGIRKQKRLLLFSVKELTPKFVSETGINLPYATLLRAKPFWVVAPKLRDRKSCLCVKHENFEFKMNKLKNLQQINHGSVEKIIEDYSCDMTSYDCMNGLCEKCKNPTLDSNDNTDAVTYFQWKSVIEEKTVKGEKKTFKITKKVAITSTINELKMAFIEDIPVLKKHLYGIYSYNKLKKQLKENLTKEEVMLQIDFSENYTTKYANEIQSTHFAKNQLSIHTGVYYIKNVDNGLQSRSFATVSENLDHQAHAIWAHMKPILQTILENKDINTLHTYSDGPTSQYRNRTNIHLWLKTLINEFKQITKATWTYSEPGHGKGPMDGVGGVLKRIADRHVLMGQDVKTASDLVNLFTESTILVKEIPDDRISSAKNLVLKTLDVIPGIMNVTKITWQRGPDVTIKIYRHERFDKQLKMSALSDSLYSNFESTNVEILSRKFPEPNEPMDTNDIQELLKLKKQSIYKTIYYSSSSDEDDLRSISVRQQTAQKSISVEAGTSYDQHKENLHPNLISPGTFILIKVPTQKKTVNYRYVATCKTGVDKDDGEILVTFMNSVRNSAKKFKLDLNDVSYIAFEQIISILPMPLLKKENNRDYYYFDTDIDVYEKF